ncbi:unnamed protein product [Adineta ricciae]|uniref:Uncharacterized protein n=1 Tax=Adineta ricciae TaxID=249248 RepID=A0A815RTI1_ADIRI|nr:unnamed protein product [Adineta ricciae]CAF1479286.1 unnamed protein product [Adineta ricciae]
MKGKWMEDHSTDHWSDGLPPVIFSINTRTTCTTKKTPYQLVFGQDIRAGRHHWNSIHESAKRNNIVINDLLIDKFGEGYDENSNEDMQTFTISESISEDLESTGSEKLNEIKQNTDTNLLSTNQTITTKTRHESQRESARVNYIKCQTKRQKIYDQEMEKIAESYRVGDLVGVSINKVDRTNCDPKVMPCIIEKKTNDKNNTNFYLITPYGRLSNPFPIHHLIPMSGVKPKELENIIYDTLPTITLIQASKLFARGQSTAVCDCKTGCVKKTCPCLRASVACSTKCHVKRPNCSNNQN